MESVLWPRYISLKPRLWNWWHVLDMIGFGNKTVQGQEGTRQTGRQIIIQIERRWNGLGGDSAEMRTVPDPHCWRRQWGLAGALLSTRLFHNCWGSSPQSTLFLGVRAQWVRRGQTALQLVIREGITISFVRSYSGKGERGRTEAALRVPLLSFSFNRVGSLPALEPLGWPSAGKAASPTVIDSLSAKHSFPPFRASLIWYTDRLLPGWQTL